MNYEDSPSETVNEKCRLRRICTFYFSGVADLCIDIIRLCGVLLYSKSAGYSEPCPSSFGNLMRSTGFYLVIPLVSRMSFA